MRNGTTEGENFESELLCSKHSTCHCRSQRFDTGYSDFDDASAAAVVVVTVADAIVHSTSVDCNPSVLTAAGHDHSSDVHCR